MMARPPLLPPLLALTAFLGLLGLVAGGWAPLEEFDAAISDTFRGYGDVNPTLVTVLRVATDVADTVPFVVAGLVISVALAAGSRRRPAALCALVTVLVPVLWGLMHWLVPQPRPELGFVVVDSNGFPSGHTSNAAAAALAAVLLLWPHQGRTGRSVTVTLAVAFGVFIGLTRLALLAHWPADVLGGWLLALAVVPLAARVATRWGGADRDAQASKIT